MRISTSGRLCGSQERGAVDLAGLYQSLAVTGLDEKQREQDFTCEG